jgi:hypothetical protein
MVLVNFRLDTETSRPLIYEYDNNCLYWIQNKLFLIFIIIYFYHLTVWPWLLLLAGKCELGGANIQHIQILLGTPGLPHTGGPRLFPVRL